MNGLLRALAISILMALAIAPAWADIPACHTERDVTAYWTKSYNATVVSRISGDLLKHFMAKFAELIGSRITFTSESMVFFNVPDKDVYGMVGFKDNCYNQEKGFIAPEQYDEIMQNIFSQKTT